jgi:hypothetical protein
MYTKARNFSFFFRLSISFFFYRDICFLLSSLLEPMLVLLARLVTSTQLVKPTVFLAYPARLTISTLPRAARPANL